MSVLFYIFIGIAAIAILFLLVALVMQLNSTKHIKKLQKDVGQKTIVPDKKKSTAQPLGKVRVDIKTFNKQEETHSSASASNVSDSDSDELSEADKAYEAAPVDLDEGIRESVTASIKEFPEFSNERAMEQLGLSRDEADLFVAELIKQIEDEIPNLEAALQSNDMTLLEESTHLLKGSAVNLGEGGVADVLVEFNTYCKAGSDPDVLHDHMENLRYYLGELKEKFGA